MAALAALVSTGMTASPHGDGVAAVLASLDLPTQPSSAEGCPLTKPIVILKAARTASTDLYDKLLEVLPGCNGYPEISHDDDLLRHGCTAKAYQYQEAVWRMALGKNAIITHNPSTQGGGCFSSYFDGEDRLTELLATENATVVSWTRNNVLRQRYSEYLTSATKDFSTNMSKVERGFVKWNATGKEVVSEVVNGACEMLAIQSAAKRCSNEHHRHVVYEEYAKDPWTALKRVLTWADLKEGVTPVKLLKPHREALKTRSDELAFAGSFAYAFERPDEVFESLQAVCLDWTFWGGSFTSIHTPRPMCLAAPSCEQAGLPCSCDKPSVVHSTRNAAWLGRNQSQPDWWLEQSSQVDDQLADGVFVGSDGTEEAVSSPSPSPASNATKEHEEPATNATKEHEELAEELAASSAQALAKPMVKESGGAAPAESAESGESPQPIVKESEDVADLQKRLTDATASAAAAATAVRWALPTAVDPAVTDVTRKQEEPEDDAAHNAVDKAPMPLATSMRKQQDRLFEEYVQKQQEAPKLQDQQHLGWVWKNGNYVWQDKMMAH